LAALLGGVLVGAERAVDPPANVRQAERVGRGAGVELLVGVGESVVGVVGPLDDLDVLIEQGGQANGELAGVCGHGAVVGADRRLGGCSGGAHGVFFGSAATALRS
jgi:hypothetical protein